MHQKASARMLLPARIAALQVAQRELQQAHDHQEVRVQERTAQLGDAKDIAERSDRVKTAFLTTMSPELRDPGRPLRIRNDIEVTDTGIGISAELRVRSFKPFTQVVRAGGPRHEGTGFGFAISQNRAGVWTSRS